MPSNRIEIQPMPKPIFKKEPGDKLSITFASPIERCAFCDGMMERSEAVERDGKLYCGELCAADADAGRCGR